jgi:hypothetical protein
MASALEVVRRGGLPPAAPDFRFQRASVNWLDQPSANTPAQNWLSLELAKRP